jgi:hypothetical protein
VQFRLRTLLLAATVLPPIIASCCWFLLIDAKLAIILAVVFRVPASFRSLLRQARGGRAVVSANCPMRDLDRDCSVISRGKILPESRR